MQERLSHPRTQALRWFYAVLSSCVALMFAPGLLLLRCGTKECRMRTGQRWGRYGSDLKKRLGRKTGRRIWIHAVSVGEVDVALSLIEVLSERNPTTEFVLTMVTREGHQLATRVERQNVHISYAPFDFVGAVRRSFETFDADLLVLVELEIWPNQLLEARRLGVPVAVINARLPEHDQKKYRRVRWFMRDIFGLLTLVCAQTDGDAEAFCQMGVARDRIQITGSMKIDAALRKADRALDHESGCPPAIWDAIAQRTLLVGGSTHPGEEEILFSMIERMKTEFPDFLLVVAPRDTTRTQKVVYSAQQQGLTALTWSQILVQGYPQDGGFPVLVIDTIGDLARFYRQARVVFIGKSLTAKGGQNPMEAPAVSRPILFGPHMENFRAVAGSFLRSKAAIQVANASGLETEILSLLRNPSAADALGRAGREVVLAQAGATGQTVRLLDQIAGTKLERTAFQ